MPLCFPGSSSACMFLKTFSSFISSSFLFLVSSQQPPAPPTTSPSSVHRASISPLLRAQLPSGQVLFFFPPPLFSCSCCLPAPHRLQFHNKPLCSRPHYFFSVVLVSLTRTFRFFPRWHSLIKSRKENQFPLPWWNDLSFPITLICHCVTTLCHAEHWTDHLPFDHSSQLIITTMSNMTFPLSPSFLMHRDHCLSLIPLITWWKTVCSYNVNGLSSHCFRFHSVYSSGGQYSSGQV